ncbi:MAG: hypothetical protein JNN30_06550 [Rhodanobacteraceae bacterium]|nr:hypothetical protein [Rhodanobacteraceae bacterium]
MKGEPVAAATWRRCLLGLYALLLATGDAPLPKHKAPKTAKNVTAARSARPKKAVAAKKAGLGTRTKNAR